MGWFQSMKCATGFHDWSAWSTKRPGDCHQNRRCNACGKADDQEVHEWGTFEYTSDDSCIQERACSHCGRTARRDVVQHTWSDEDWKYSDGPGHCDQLRKCPRCGIEEKRVRHVWDVWQNEAPDSDLLVRFCRRCTERQIRYPRTIVCMPNKDIGYHGLCIMQMNQIAPLRQNDSDLASRAQMVELSRQENGCRLEIGHRPASPRQDFDYLSWDWDDSKNRYAVVKWDGRAWVRF